jgi:hypothetical protein
MAVLEAVDRLEVTILVDNVTDNLSSTPSFVETETARLWRIVGKDCPAIAASPPSFR